MKEGVGKNMMNILICIGLLAFMIDSVYQRALAKHYKQKYYDTLSKYNDTADELHHLKIKYDIIPIPCWEM